MKVWIDIVNAPHVWFFKPIIQYLEDQGEEVYITARRFGDVHELLDLYDIPYTSVGSHGATLEQKLLRSTERVYNLSKIIEKEKPDVAVSKHSIELPRVSFGLKIPSVYVMDNEHATAANRLTLPLCNRIIIPKAMNVWDVLKTGADPNSLTRFDGTSEVIHFEDFHYNPHIMDELEIDLKKDKTILMRPEPALASYLDADCKESVLTPIVRELEEHANILIIPRFKEQEDLFKNNPQVNIIKPPVDTFSLIRKSDLVIGAGGTMNRESAILGTPVISCYPGNLLAVDGYYIEKGLMKRSNNIQEVVSMARELLINHKEKKHMKTDKLLQIMIDNIYGVVSKIK